MTQEAIILNLLRKTGEWTPSYELQKRNTEWGWLGTSGDRAARRLAESGKIERRQVGKYAYYRCLPTGFKTFYIKDRDGNVLQEIKEPTYT